MGISIRTLIRANIEAFLGALSRLKRRIDREEVLSSTLLEMEQSYSRLTALLNREMQRECRLERIDTVDGITRYRIAELEFLLHETHGVLSVSTGDPGINRRVMHSVRRHPCDQQLQAAAAELEMYVGHRTSNCDLCGEYSLVPGFETPTGRSVEEDFVLVYHPLCREKSIRKA